MAECEEFQKGKIVILNSGGPYMSIINVINDMIYVSWIDDDKKQQYANFPYQCLRLQKD